MGSRRNKEYFLSKNDNKYTHFISSGSVNCVLYNLNSKKVIHCKNSIFMKIIEGKASELPEEILEEIGELYKIHIVEPNEPPITKILINITDACNYNCKNCYSGNYNHQTLKQMGDEVIKSILSLEKRKQVGTVSILGGEPFLNNRLNDLIENCHNDGTTVQLFTNGSFLNSELMAFLKENEVITRLTLYSRDREKHDMYTGVNGSFDNIIRWMKKLKSNGNSLKMTLAFSYDEYVEYLNDKYSLVPETIERFVDILKPIISDPLEVRETYISQRRAGTPQNYKPVASVGQEMVINNIFRYSCYGYELTIDSDGQICDCPWITDKKYGDIRFCSDIPDRGKPMREQYEICAHCEFNFMCYDCTYVNNILGENHVKPLLCRYNPETGEYDDN